MEYSFHTLKSDDLFLISMEMMEYFFVLWRPPSSFQGIFLLLSKDILPLYSHRTSIFVPWRCLSLSACHPQILSKDSVTVAVDAVVYYRVSNATISITNVEDANRSTRLLAQTTLRNVLGTKNLSEILSDRENISHFMQVYDRGQRRRLCVALLPSLWCLASLLPSIWLVLCFLASLSPLSLCPYSP